MKEIKETEKEKHRVSIHIYFLTKAWAYYFRTFVVVFSSVHAQVTSVLQVMVVLLIFDWQVCLAAQSPQRQQTWSWACDWRDAWGLQPRGVRGQLDRGSVGSMRKVLSLELLLLSTHTFTSSGSEGKGLWTASTELRWLVKPFSHRMHREEHWHPNTSISGWIKAGHSSQGHVLLELSGNSSLQHILLIFKRTHCLRKTTLLNMHLFAANQDMHKTITNYMRFKQVWFIHTPIIHAAKLKWVCMIFRYLFTESICTQTLIHTHTHKVKWV